MAPENVLTGLPVSAPVSQGFGCSPYFTSIPGPDCGAELPWFHDGLDLATALGTPVRAALTGEVIFAGADGTGPSCGDQRGYGLSVVVDGGNGWQAMYAHLSEIFVTAGQVVTTDTVLGLSGDTGCTSGPHLHFGLRRDGELVDPMQFTP
jgi:murein DD-endopeptidase MepM/ murein hydrolase activator NlpD